LAAGDRVIGWRVLGVDSSTPIGPGDFEEALSWNALRWKLMDALTGEFGFALEVQTPSGGDLVKRFPAESLPKIKPDSDSMGALGLLPQSTPLSEWQTLKLNPLKAWVFATQRVWLITKVSGRLMVGMVTGKSSLKQLGGPLSIADMAGKSAQVGWQPFLAFLAMISISIGMLNLLSFPMLDGGQLLYDSWELVAGKRISVSMQERLQRVGFLLLISLSLLALFNDLQRYFSP
jgi:regulator of sigma E protease